MKPGWVGAARIDAVAFDLDGTLVDSAADIGHALNSALGKAGLRRFDVATLKNWIGDGPDALIVRALVAQGLPADPLLCSRLRRAFDMSTLAAPLNYGNVFPGIVDMLGTLAERFPLIVVTNKPTPLARAVLDAARLGRFIRTVYGADSAGLRKPSPAMLLNAAQRLGTVANCLLMVGDSSADLLSAAAAGCPAAWAAWGYGPAETGTATGVAPDAWRLASPAELPRRLICSAADVSLAVADR